MADNSNVLLKIDNKETLSLSKYKSSFKIGNFTINNIKHFNWLQKLMYKILFGIEIEDLRKGKE